jgi:hypothetical protein
VSSTGITLDGVDLPEDAPPHVEVDYNSVGPDFFHTLGVPVVEGRDVSDADTPSSPPIVLVNETFARQFFMHAALGHRLGRLPGAEIVGIVKDAKSARVRERQLPVVYYPLSQSGMLGQVTVEVRTAGDPMAVLGAVRRVVRELDPNLSSAISTAPASRWRWHSPLRWRLPRPCCPPAGRPRSTPWWRCGMSERVS